MANEGELGTMTILQLDTKLGEKRYVELPKDWGPKKRE